MLVKYLLGFISLLFLFTVLGGLCVPFTSLYGNEPTALELVKKHDDQLKKMKSIQLSYTKKDKSRGVDRSFPHCYWESDVERSRAIVTFQDGDVEMCGDFFHKKKDSYALVVPKNKYPLSDMRLCDYASNLDNIEGCFATFIPEGTDSIGTDIRLRFPLPRYFVVHTEKNFLTLLELANKYPSNIVSVRKNASGDDITEIFIVSPLSNNEQLGPWELKVCLNASKDYNIDSYRLSTTIKMEKPIKAILDRSVKKYIEIEGGFWIPSDWESIEHNGNPTTGERTNYVINDCKINKTLQSRLDDFCFPANFPVREVPLENQPEKIHIWGSENKPVRTFANHIEFAEYYSNECISGMGQPKENKYLTLRISLMVLGLLMIAYALYRLYAKER